MQQQRSEAVPQVVRPGALDASGPQRPPERAPTPRLIRGLASTACRRVRGTRARGRWAGAKRAATPAGRSRAARAAARSGAPGSWCRPPAERHRPLDQQRPITNVAPPQPERLAGSQPRIGEHTRSGRVALTGRGAHRLDRRRRERTNLVTARPRRRLDALRTGSSGSARLDRVLEDRAEQLQRLPNGDRAGALTQLRLPARRRLRVKSRSRTAPRSGAQVPVVETLVVLPGLWRERDSVRRCPRRVTYSPRVSVPASS